MHYHDISIKLCVAMSGFEVAGVVVGAVPLIVIALERYQKLGRMRDAFRKRSLHLDRMIRALKWQQRLIHSDVKIVLRNAGLDEETTSQHERLDRLQDLFEREDVQDAVRDFLGDKHDAYLEVMQDFQRTLLEIAKSIKGFQEDSWVRAEQRSRNILAYRPNRLRTAPLLGWFVSTSTSINQGAIF